MYDNVTIISGCHYLFNGISVSFIRKTFGSFFTKQEIGINVKTSPLFSKILAKSFWGVVSFSFSKPTMEGAKTMCEMHSKLTTKTPEQCQ